MDREHTVGKIRFGMVQKAVDQTVSMAQLFHYLRKVTAMKQRFIVFGQKAALFQIQLFSKLSFRFKKRFLW